jgi:hypothetical protein
MRITAAHDYDFTGDLIGEASDRAPIPSRPALVQLALPRSPARPLHDA